MTVTDAPVGVWIELRVPLHKEGATVATVSGRTTTPMPKWDMSTERRTANSLRRQYGWSYENAQAEAASRGLYFLAQPHPRKGDPPSGDIDECALILFGRLIVNGRIVGPPERAYQSGYLTPENLATLPRWYSHAEILQMALDVLLGERAA